MALSNDIISQFVELTKTSDKIQNEASVYGTIVTDGNNTYVKLDGSEQLTPIETTTNVAGGERVIVRIKDHKATVTGNITSPSVNNGQLEDVKDQISEFEVVIADRVTANEIVVGRIEADNVIINKKLTAIEGEFETIKADNITINEKLTANKAAIADLDAKKLSAETADLKYATIGGLNAANAEINDLKANHAEFSEATIKRLEADEASIKKLDAEKLSAKDADIKYANIDFANINMAAVEKLFAESGIIKDLVVGDTSITGELVGVTIKGDLIEANTLVADKLVIKGSDGLYYKLNTDGMTTEAEQTEYNSLNGSIITAKSITATKISVDDLVAFDATIGGFNITSNSIYSGVKSSVDNTTKGVYLDKDGQIAFGDSNNFLKFFRDTDGKWKLNISANSLKFSTSDKTVEEVIEDIDTKVQKTVKTVADYYASSSSATTKPITGWQTTPPEWVNGKFIWAKTKTTYTDDTSSESEPVCITGAKGDTGKPGADGSSGVGISSVDVEYYLSTSSTALAGGSWSTNSPTWVDGKYMWSRTKTTTTDGKSTTSEPVCITGGKGATGSNGVTGQGVESITEEYYLSTSKTTQSGGSWVTTPPTWSSGKYLWTRSKIVYKNPTETSYTKPVCDNSWEAVNEVEIGGRNLFISSMIGSYIGGDIVKLRGATYENYKFTVTSNPVDLVGATITNFEKEIIVSGYTDLSQIVSYWKFDNDTQKNVTKSVTNGKFEIRISVPSGAKTLNIGLGQFPYVKGYFIKNIMIQNGNKATDWTPSPEDVDNKIDSIEIGGRNLLQNSNFAFGLDGWYKHDYHTVEIVKDSTYGNVVKITALDNNTGGIFKVPTVNFKNEEVYTMSVYIKSSVVGSQIGIAIDGNGLADGEIFTISVANEWVKLVSTFKTSGVNPNIRVYSVKSSGCIFHITNIKVEKGNKATDWTPAPEDVEANINNLEDTMNGAFKDGILSESEKKAIKQSLNIIKGDMTEVDKIYETLNKNSNLVGTPKTNLYKAKMSYNNAYTSLVSFINTALSASIVTEEMKKSIDSAFGTYRTELGIFNTRVQEAIDAINSKKIDNIEIGGRNLVLDSSDAILTSKNQATKFITLCDDILNIINSSIGKPFILSVDIEMDNCTGSISNGNQRIGAEVSLKHEDNTYSYIGCWIKPAVGDSIEKKRIYGTPVIIRKKVISVNGTGLYNQLTCNNSTISKPKFEIGNKATDWTPAPEDVENSMNNKIDNIKIGGENLIFREKYWQTNNPTVVQLTAEPEHSRIRIKKVTADEAKHTYLNFVKTLTKGKTYTLSYDIYTDMTITSEQLLFLRCNGNSQALQYMKDQTVSSINTWIHKELTFVCNHSGTDNISIDSLALSTSHFNEGQTILLRNVKMEEGNKATTYSYAPEDERLEASRAGVNMLPNTKSLIVTGLTGVNYKYERRDIVTAINLKPFTIYTVSFKCKVLSGSTTKCSVGVTNSKIDVVYQRGDLTITKDRISWTFYTRNATNCSTLLFYAGQAGQTGTNKLEYSEIMLEETSIASEKWIPNAGDVDYVIESKKVAINNLILNTKNMKDTSGWTGNIGVTRSGVLNEPVFYNITTTTSEAVSGTSRFRVKPNTKYCFSMLLNINYSCSSVDVWWIAKFKDSTNDYDNTIRFIAEWQEARDKYARVVGTFITGPNDYDGYIRIDNNGKLASATGNSSIYWTEAMVAEGDVFSGYSPSIKDMDLRVTKAESDLIVVNNAISAKVWGEDINVALGRQADNLVRNGNGGTKDNSNFSKYTFVGNFRGSRDYPSFLKGTSPYFAPNDDRIYIDRSKDYILSYEIRAKLADAKNKIYFAIDCYDIDGYSIPSYNNLFISKTTTKLKKELNNGDMTIEVESLSNWLTASSIPAYQRSVIFWNYKDSTGYQYPKETYSRNSQEKFGNGLWDSISDEDKSSGIIRLKNPWSGGSYPIGTEISQGNSGATYMYVGAFGVVSFNDRWIPYNVTVPGSSFRPGTAFIKMGLYGGQPTYISNLYFGIDRATSGQLNDLSNTVTNVQKTVSQHTIDLSGITSKVEKIESSDFQVHNLQRHSGGKYKDAGIEAWSMSGKDTLSWFTNYGSPGTFEDYYDLYKGGSSGAIYAYSQSPIPVTDGEKYTVSFNYGRSAVGGATHRFVIQCSNTYPFGAVTKKVIDRYMPSDKANEIIRQEFQFTIPADTKSIKVALANSVSGEGQSCSFYIDKIMINKGLVAYDWSPHEYDIESQFKSVEQKITAESILTTISSGINGNKGTISTMQFLLDKDGATIRNGALKILNNAGTTVLSGDSNGNISMTGVYKNVNSRNLTSFKIADSTITFFDGRSEGEKMGTIFSGYMQTSPDKATSLTIGHYLDASLRLSYGKADSNGAILFYPYVELDIYNINGRTNEKVGYPITIIQPVIIQEKSMVCSPMAFDNWGYNGRLEFYDYRLYGGNLSLGSVLNGRVKGSTSDIGDMCFLGRRGSNPKANAYAVLGQMLEGSSYDYNRNVVTSSSGTTVYGNFYVNGGTKNRIVTTNDFGVVKMNAYETSGCYFGDIGNGLIGEDGTCIIAMDIIYLETVNTKCDYFVFLQKYGSGDLWVEDRDETYFIVKGTPGMKFAWEVKARQRGYETDRLDQKLEDDGPATTYGCELTDRSQEEMEKLLKSMEEE